MKQQIKSKNELGLTLIEVIIAIALLGIFFTSILSFALNFEKIILINKIRLQILTVLQDEIEKMRAMDYENIGIAGGWPPGSLPSQKVIEKNGLKILVNYYIRNIDNPKDGTITSTPADTAPADYKLIELEGRCLNCLIPSKIQSLTTIIAPKTVESRTTNGSLFIHVIDANGSSVSGANIKVEHLGTPNFVIEDLSDNTGFLRLIDIPPGINVYRIYVTKSGYSSERSYPLGNEQNPNPILPDQTVESGKLTTATFKIDKLSNLNFNFIDNFCQPISGIQFTLQGNKLIGQDPNVLKTVITTTTKNFSIEWDDYNFQVNSLQYIIRGSVPYLKPKIYILPGRNYDFQIILASSSPINLLITVLDPNRNYVQDAEVKLIGNNLSLTEYTGFEKIIHDNWVNNFSEISNNINVLTKKIEIKNLEGSYLTSTEWLISKTLDLGTTSTQFKMFSWEGNIPDSTFIRFQIAANNDNSNWNFIGPDGTSNSFFENSSFSLDRFNGNRFLRYKVFLKTDDPNITPILRQIKITYSSNCLSPGQIIFQNLKNGSYTLEVTKQGFSRSITSLDILPNENYKEVEVNLLPQ